jgi:hypothetical protein
LIALLQSDLNEKIKHFSLEGSSIQSKKLVGVLQELTMNDHRSLQSLALTDLTVPLKKTTIAAVCSLLQSLDSSKTSLVLERCVATEDIICNLLKTLTNIKQL